MKRNTKEIRALILETIDANENIACAVTSKFGITRQAVAKNVRALMAEGLIAATGEGRNRTYALKILSKVRVDIRLSPQETEDTVWMTHISPHLKDVKENVREICHYGFTEMFNNVIDHSESQTAVVNVWRNALSITIAVQDHGVGIWRKLQQRIPTITDPRHALLELSKGKLTTDPDNHTGEGIFFTSRMFDRFLLASDKLSFCRFTDGLEWLFDVKEDNFGPGTRVSMEIRLNSEKTVKSVFDQFASELEDFGFTKTWISVELAKYEGDHLVSRSQAKRLMARLDRFKEVFLDFKGISTIGQAFADQVFRVFAKEHPNIRLIPCNESEDVKKMIERAMKGALGSAVEQPELPLN